MKTIYLSILFLFSIHVFAQPSCQWAYIPDGTNAYNTIVNVAVDRQGNIIQTGQMLGVADMDPGTGAVDTSFTKPGYNYYFSKTDINGHLLWIKYFIPLANITTFDFIDVRVNSDNDIILLGGFYGLIDFDLSDAGVDTLRSHFPTYQDYFLAMYDSSGNYKWAFNIGDPTTHNIDAKTMVLQSNDDILVAANPNGAIDVDPGPAVHTSIGANANLICYDKNGNYLWNNNIGQPTSYSNQNKSVDVDAAGNVYLLSVGYYELTVSKMSSNGLRIWDKTIGDFSSGARVNPQSFLVDKTNGDFYVAGTFGGTVDFDPGPNTVTKISNNISYQDGFIARYDSSMNLIWVNPYYGNIDFGNYTLDYAGNDIIASGSFTGQIDFGNGVILTTSTSSPSPFYLKLNSTGISQNGFILDGIGNFNTLNSTGSGSFVTSGYISTSTDMDPSAATLIINSTIANQFTAVYNDFQTSVPELIKKENAQVYPNPANGNFTVKLPGNYGSGEITVYNSLSQLIYNESFSVAGEKIIKLKDVARGIYLVKIKSGENESTQKLIIE